MGGLKGVCVVPARVGGGVGCRSGGVGVDWSGSGLRGQTETVAVFGLTVRGMIGSRGIHIR